MDKNFINNTILILILLLLANYLSNGSIINVLKKYYNLLTDLFFKNTEGFMGIFGPKEPTFEGLPPCSYTTPEIMHDNDFKYIYNDKVKSKRNSLVEEPEMKKLYHFLQSLVTINKNINELTPSVSKKINLSQAEIDNLRKNLTKSLNCNKEFKFINIDFIDNLVYFNNPRGKEIKPFKITTDAYINNVSIGKLTIYFEMFIRMDDLFYGPVKSGFPSITRVKLVDRIPQIEPEAHDFDEDKYNNTDDSLIPDSVHFSTDYMGKDESSSITIPNIETTSELVTTNY